MRLLTRVERLRTTVWLIAAVLPLAATAALAQSAASHGQGGPGGVPTPAVDAVWQTSAPLRSANERAPERLVPALSPAQVAAKAEANRCAAYRRAGGVGECAPATAQRTLNPSGDSAPLRSERLARAIATPSVSFTDRTTIPAYLSPSIAVGPTRILTAYYMNYLAVYDKVGNLLARATPNFTGLAGVGGDARVLWDPYLARFWMVVNGNDGTVVAIGLSNTSDPLPLSSSGWRMWLLNIQQDGGTSTTNICGLPQIGVDTQAVYLACDMMSSSTLVFQYAKVRVMSKSQFVNNTCCAWWDRWGMTDADGVTKSRTLLPAHMVGATDSDGEFVVNSDFAIQSKIEVMRITNPLNCCTSTPSSPTFAFATATTAAWSVSPDASQPGTTTLIDTAFPQLRFALWRRGKLLTGHNVGCNSGADSCLGVKEINTSSYPSLTIINDWDLAQTGVDLYYPAADVNGLGQRTLVYTRSGPTELPSMAIVGIPDSGTCTQCIDGSEIVVKVGEANYGSYQWGPFLGATADPDGVGIWVNGLYAASPGATVGSRVALTYESAAQTVSAPVATSLVPSSATAGGASLGLIVNGGSFVPSAMVLWNGSPRTTTYVSSTQLTALISATDIQNPGTAQVTVQQAGLTSGALSFIIGVSGVSVTSLSPSSVFAVGPAFTLTVNGSGFVSGATVLWNGAARTTTFISGTQVTAAISAVDIATPGSATVAVRVSPFVTSNTVSFTITTPTPVISALSPSSVPVGSAAFVLTVNGSAFVSGATVVWNGSDRTTTYLSSTQLRTTITASDVATAGTFPVTVRQPNSTIVSAAVPFSVVTVSATISSLSPSTIAAGSAGFTLTVNGSGFLSGSTVLWNGAPRTTAFVSANQMTAQIPPTDIAVGGTVAVQVRLPNNALSNTATFTITSGAAVLTSVSPGIVVFGGAAFTLTVTGQNFVSGASVSISGNPRTTTFLSSTQLNANILAADLTTFQGPRPITVTNPASAASNTVNLLVSNSDTAYNLSQYVPHIPYGGSFTTKLTVTNLSGSSPAPFLIRYYNQSGALLKTEGYLLNAAQTVRVNITGGSSTLTQWAVISTQATLLVNAFFEINGGGGPTNVTNTIGFNDQPSMTDFSVPVELQPSPAPGITIGIALANPNASSTTVTLQLVGCIPNCDATTGGVGVVLATDTVNLNPLGQQIYSLQDATRLPNIAARLPNGNFLGVLTVHATSPITAIALEDDFGPFSAIPIMPGRAR